MTVQISSKIKIAKPYTGKPTVDRVNSSEYFMNDRANYDFRIAELTPQHTTAKSFYGKAIVHKNRNTVCLCSYGTPVAYIGWEKGDTSTNTFHRLWNDYSQTTLMHVNEFRQQHNLLVITASEWKNMPVSNRHFISMS